MSKWSRPWVVIPVVVVLAVVLAGALYLFQPWKLFTSVKVYEAVPTSSTQIDQPALEDAASPAPVSAEPTVLATGTFISHEHPTSGTVRVIQLSDGTRVLRLENLQTSNGPMLEVWLADAPVTDGIEGWRVFDGAKHISLGDLKGNVGDQNYVIPADVSLADYSAVTIWCARFHVSFGAAALKTQS